MQVSKLEATREEGVNMNRRFHIALSILTIAAAAWIAPPATGQTPAAAPQKPVAAKAAKASPASSR